MIDHDRLQEGLTYAESYGREEYNCLRVVKGARNDARTEMKSDGNRYSTRRKPASSIGAHYRGDVGYSRPVVTVEKYAHPNTCLTKNLAIEAPLQSYKKLCPWELTP